MFNFTPTDENTADVIVPYLEDATAEFSTYHSSRLTISKAKQEVIQSLGKLGAGVMGFQDGYYEAGGRRRHGYLIRFNYRGAIGHFPVAGLPIRKETARRIEKVKVQALLIARDWIEASVNHKRYSPGSDPLIGKLLVDNNQSIEQVVSTRGELPLRIDRGDDISEGEFTEITG